MFVLAMIVVTTYIQEFERGYIQYCGTSSAEYAAYAKTYLPDARIDKNTLTPMPRIPTLASASRRVR